MRIIEERSHPGLARLYLAAFNGRGDRFVEIVDTLEPEVPKTQKWVMMVSTQLGCPVGCRMCDAGSLGYRGNLTAEEIMEQIRFVASQNPDLPLARHPKVKIHFARMGEPSLNPEVLSVLELLAEEFPYAGILPSFSTVAPRSPAVRPFFDELIRLKNSRYPGGRFQLQFSLHSTDENQRREIVPIKTWSLEEIAEYGVRFQRAGDRKITLNFALNRDSIVDPDVLGRFFSPDRFLIKITPTNPTHVSESNDATQLWNEPPPAVRGLADALTATRGFEVILSPSLPGEVEAETSCGQLWSGNLKERARTMLRNRSRERESYVTPESLEAKSEEWSRAVQGLARRRQELRLEASGLLVVDMQGFFLDPKSPGYKPPARAVLGNVRRLVDAFREAGRPVGFTLHAHKDPARDGGMMLAWWRKVCLAGTDGARIPPLLEPREAEIFRKCRYSAFSNPSLRRFLRSRGVESIVVAGVMTNLCVESTVRDAFDLGFRTFVVLDATAAHTEELHLASLKNLAFGFSSVVKAEKILGTLETATP